MSFTRLKKTLTGLALAFSCVAVRGTQAQQKTLPVPIEGLWLWKDTKDSTVTDSLGNKLPALDAQKQPIKIPYVNAVMDLKICPGTTDKPCMTIYWVHPTESPKTFDAFGPLEETKKKIPNPDNEDFRNVTPQDVLALCGYSPPLIGGYDGGNVWEGHIAMRGREEPFTWRSSPLQLEIKLTKVAEDTLALVVQKHKFGKRGYYKEVNWTRISPKDKAHPSCKPVAPQIR